MIVMILHISVPIEKAEETLDLFESYMGPVYDLPGHMNTCLKSQSTHSENFVLIQMWEDRKLIENHIRSDNFRKILAIMELANEPPKLFFHTVSSTEGFELVERLRTEG